jgi:hypothetical protein
MRPFQVFGPTLALAIALPIAAQTPLPLTPARDASAVLAAARAALGGDQRLSEIKTFSARGRTRQIRGANLVPIEFEIWCELPDKYVRRDEIPAQESGPTSNGFSGDTLIQWPPPAEPAPGAKPAAPVTGASAKPAAAKPAADTAAKPEAAAKPASPADPKLARVASVKQDFVRLTLGMFATSFASYPLTFTVAGQAEAPQGRADVIDVKGPGTFALRLFINSDAHLPIMVSWTTPAANVVIKLPGDSPPENLAPGTIIVTAPPLPPPTAPKEEQEQYAKTIKELRQKTLATAKPVEQRLYYGDYRDIGNGLRFPFRLRRATAGETIEETNFDEFKINVRIDPRRFVVTK